MSEILITLMILGGSVVGGIWLAVAFEHYRYDIPTWLRGERK